ncbi:unnamed protein product [Ilex paraguariensis]|uniref:Uncharacterized protein n=1 Tax=Ilex paraguariensis TaxID=185542 RepID=A0ABC8TIM1_9AQUA
MGDLPEDTTALVDDHNNLLSEAIGDVSIAKEHKIHSYGRSFNGFVARLLPHEAKTLLVYMGDLPEDTTALVDDHNNLLSEAIGDVSIAKEHKIHSYGRSFNGFVARLLPHEAKTLLEKERVVSVFPSTVRKLRTTRSWDFMGMPETVKRNNGVESNLIVGLLDSGIWIKSPSFNDEGYGPPPPRWRGKCSKGANFTGCNNACDYGTLSENKVKGKIVLCLGYTGQDGTINDLHGSGTIMTTDQFSDVAFTFLLPATLIDVKAGEKIDRYINSTKTAKAVIYKSRTVNMTAPFVASFSSRGPQLISQHILKPDIAAPGLNILAAYSQLTTVTGATGDKRIVKYNIESGTSMACPHVAAAAAYVKSFHPQWSPAAIKSALMTTATPMKIKPVDAELASGSGQINPTRALHPGLVYDMNTGSYVRFLCKEGYNSTTISLLTGGKKKYNCSTLPARGFDGINYPSMHIQLTKPNSSISAVFHRTVTNVGYGKSVYKAKVMAPKGLSVRVIPRTLTFERSYQKRSYHLMVKGKFIKNTEILSASLLWSDSKHKVRSPILVYRSLSQDYQ